MFTTNGFPFEIHYTKVLESIFTESFQQWSLNRWSIFFIWKKKTRFEGEI